MAAILSALDAPAFPVRVTRYPGSDTRALAAELRNATGLAYDGDACRWYVTQAEFDLPHHTFRLDAI